MILQDNSAERNRGITLVSIKGQYRQCGACPF